MSILWTFFWPCVAIGLLVGGLAGTIGFRRAARRNMALAIGSALTLVLTLVWSGPLGAADRFTTRIERDARDFLDHYEMTQIAAHLHRGPLSRHLVLSGQADDYQRAEMVRLMSERPGVSGAQWTERPTGVPLLGEALTAAIAGFIFGLGLAYLNELRRHNNAQWNW